MEITPQIQNTFSITPVVYFTGFNPIDSLTYYAGISGIAPQLTATNCDFNLGYAFTLVGMVFAISANTIAGTSEDVTMNLRNVTQGTSSLIGVIQTNGGSTSNSENFTFTALTIAVAATDFICIEMVCPAWATNPAGTRIYGIPTFKR